MRAIEAVAAGRRWLPEYVAVELASGMTAEEELTPRVQEVLEHLQLGISNKEIGRCLQSHAADRRKAVGGHQQVLAVELNR